MIRARSNSKRNRWMFLTFYFATAVLTFQNCGKFAGEREVLNADNTVASANDGSSASADGGTRLASYNALPDDLQSTAGGDVLTLNVENKKNAAVHVLIESDGRFSPLAGTPQLHALLYVDGVAVGSNSVIDWQQSQSPAQHSFNVVALASLSPGAHVITLQVTNSVSASQFLVGGGTNLIVLESSAKTMQVAATGADFGPYSVNSIGTVPIYPFLTLPQAVEGPAALLLSGRMYVNGAYGDAMTGLALDGSSCPATNQQSWSVNDLASGSENQAPFFAHGIQPASSGFNPAAIASVFPWAAQKMVNPVKFAIGAKATLISVERPAILGSGANPTNLVDSCNTLAYLCLGSSDASGCHPSPQRTVLATAQATIPPGHDGVVLFMAKTRVQADTQASGFVVMGLTIDGIDRGFVGTQQLIPPNGISQRTITASFLASDQAALSVGSHTVQVWLRPQGTFAQVYANQDLTLLYFD